MQIVSTGDIYSLGEASSFSLHTDACRVTFLPVRGRTHRDPLDVRMQVAANGSLENVLVQTDFCDSSQFVRVNNSRDALNRYKGYVCEIDIGIPEDPSHTAPVMEISNIGTEATFIRKASQTAVVNFGANMFSVSGTILEMELSNVKARRFSVPYLESGFLMLQNTTFMSMGVKTVAADVLVSVSQEPDMLVPYSILYKQSTNNVCFVSRNDSAGENLYAHTDRCQFLCRSDSLNVLTTTEPQGPCVRSCTQSSSVRLVPYKRDLQPGLKDHLVDLESVKGQVFFFSHRI
mmetsp:Transcript_24229/g.60940  ORF Transcript_24229/g.60940 Transcript_24229/m.60940 type:complete len:290 (+) Transcript_24229:5411-6280(+)